MLLLPERAKTFKDEMKEIVEFITKAYNVVVPIAFDYNYDQMPKDNELPTLRFHFHLFGFELDHSFALDTFSDDHPFIEVILLSLDMKFNQYYRKVVSIEALIHELIHFRLHSPFVQELYDMHEDEIGKYHADVIESIVNIETFRLIKKYNKDILDSLGIDLLKEIEFNTESKMISYKNDDRGSWVYNTIGVIHWYGYDIEVRDSNKS